MKKLLLLGIISTAFLSCTTDDAETGKSAANRTGIQANGPGDSPIIVPPPPIKKQSVVSKGPGDATIPVPPPPKPK